MLTSLCGQVGATEVQKVYKASKVCFRSIEKSQSARIIEGWNSKRLSR